MIPVQFLTYSNADFSHEESALVALNAGCRWIHFRPSHEDSETIRTTAQRLKQLCAEKGATLIINDNAEICKELQLDGVFVCDGTPLPQIRRIVGEETLLASKAENAEDALRLAREGADYILADAENCQAITQALHEDLRRLPVVATGNVSDVLAVLESGAKGIAIEGSEHNAESIESLLKADED